MLEVPEGNITQALPEAAGLNPAMEIVAFSEAVGLLFTMKRVKFPEASVAA